MIKFEMSPNAPVGWDLFLIEEMLDPSNPLPAHEQIDRAYQHGGGWSPFNGFKMDPNTLSIKYPGDPPLKPWAKAKFRDQLIIVYPYSWVAIINPDKSFIIARID